MVYMIAILFATSIYLVAYQFLGRSGEQEVHLSSEDLKDENAEFQNVQNTYLGVPIRKTWSPLTSKYKQLDKRLRTMKLPFDIRRKLIKAGSPMGVMEFLALEILSIFSFPVLGLILVGEKFSKQSLLFFTILMGLVLPLLWLNTQIKKRQFQIRKDLPNVIDLLNICVSGGLDFMLAVARVIKDLRPCDITMELAELHRETQMGATRREAMKNLAWRLDMPEIYSFVRTLIQADRMGTSIGEALKIQSEEMRTRRFQRGESMALKAPIKLLFPLFVFILPVVLIIVAAPVLLNFARQSGGKIGF